MRELGILPPTQDNAEEVAIFVIVLFLVTIVVVQL